MKKLLFSLVFSLFTVFSYGQTFNGIDIDGNINDFVSKMKQKGYVFEKYTEGGGAILKGIVSGNSVEFWVSVTPKSKIVWKLSIYFPESNSWYSLKSDYTNYKTTLTEKYGEPSSHYEFFTNPYYEGDGYEMTAVSVEKATFASYWINKTSNYAIGVQITKFSQLRISYENNKNYEIFDKEKKQINNSTF
jgi:hypothetical protein